MNALSEYIHATGYHFIIFAQQSLPGKENLFMDISLVGDPSLIFTFYFPLIASISSKLGSSLLWTVLLCEWSNMLLKWIMAGDRPFWWKGEMQRLTDGDVHLHQYSMTCETGPGMPSGHSTLNAALFFIITKAVIAFINRGHFLSKFQKQIVKYVLWGVYVVWMILVLLSRTYIAAHFPHQCILGIIIGIYFAVTVEKMEWLKRMNVTKSFFISAMQLVTVLGVFGTYVVFGGNPMWSMTKATEWCVDSSFIHVDSKPFYSLSRFSGQSLGLGLVTSSKHYKAMEHKKISWITKFAVVLASLLIGNGGAFLHKIIDTSMAGYYLIEFIINVSLPYAVLMLPRYLHNLQNLRY